VLRSSVWKPAIGAWRRFQRNTNSSRYRDRVSALCRGLDEKVATFRGRPLDGQYPYLWLDAKWSRSATVVCVTPDW